MISYVLALLLSASLTLKITDTQNAAIPNARVAIHSQNRLSALHRTTDGEGVLRIDLPAGTFVIEVDADGSRQVSRTIRVADDGYGREEFSLTVAGVNSSVVVTASDAPQTV